MNFRVRLRQQSKKTTGRRQYFRPVFIAWRQGAGLALAVLALTLASCLPPPELFVPATPTLSQPTLTATVTPTPSPTIVWFPATATRTPLPTRSLEPTQDTRPAVGALLFKDDFRDPNEWPAARTAAGSVDFGNRELTLAVSAARGTLASLRNDTQLDNFYLELEVQPSLCQANDQFGLLLRASSGQDYYRLLVNCSGQVRLERIIEARALVLQDWLTTGQIPPGGMLRFRLAVWAHGPNMRVFVNDVFQFAVRDPAHPAGTLGLYARAAGDSPLTVSFSKLAVYAIDSDRVPTPVPSPTPSLVPSATRRPTATPAP